MTKKEFKQKCNHHDYVGTEFGKNGIIKVRHNALYFDYNSCDEGTGYKYAVAAKAGKDGCSKAELYNQLHDWVFNQKQPDWFVRYKFANTDKQRFKVGLSLNF